MPVPVRKLQVGVLTRSFREVAQTVRIDCHSDIPFYHACASEFGFAIVLMPTPNKTRSKNRVKASVQLNTIGTSKQRQPERENCGHSGDSLSQKTKKQHIKTATTRVYLFTDFF